MTTTNVTDATWEDEVTDADLPVLVDIWAPWCGPCKQIGPIIEELSEDYAGKIKVVKVNADENTEILAAQGIRGIPALIFYKDGIRVDTVVGMMPKSDLVSLIEEKLLSKET